MASQSTDNLSELKSVIRGLMASTVGEMSIRRLEREYEVREGIPIPYSDFGYPSLEFLLMSIPDVVRLRKPVEGCPSHMILVDSVQCSRSEHIESMVSLQNNSRALLQQIRNSRVSGSQAGRRDKKDSPKGMVRKFIHFTLRTSLARVCHQHAPEGLPLESLGKELSRDLSMTGWAEEGRCGWIKANGFDSVEEVVDGLLENGLIQIVTHNGRQFVKSIIGERYGQSIGGELVSRGGRQRTDLVVEVSGPSVSPQGPSDEDVLHGIVAAKMKASFLNVLEKYPDGLWCADLPKEYEAITGEVLDVRQMGFLSVVEMASKLTDIFSIFRPGSHSDWLLFDCKSFREHDSTVPPAKRIKVQKDSIMSWRFVDNIQKLLMDYPEGIEWNKFLEAYEIKHEEEIPWVEFGFQNPKAVLEHLELNKVLEIKISSSVPIVCLPSTDSADRDDFINGLYPPGVVGYGQEIPLQDLPDDLVRGDLLDVFITEVETPSCFYFQLWENKLQKDFHAMMHVLNNFYEGDGFPLHKVPYSVMMVGQYCAIKYPSTSDPTALWHRAMITSVVSLTEIEVYYVDYGTRVKVQRSDLIYFLDDQFTKLPCLAHKASLTCIRPVGYGFWKCSPATPDKMNRKPTWSRAAYNYLKEVMLEKPVVAVIAGVRESDNYLSVSVADTSEEIDKHINDMLVEVGLAEFGEFTDDEDLYSRLNPFKQIKKN